MEIKLAEESREHVRGVAKEMTPERLSQLGKYFIEKADLTGLAELTAELERDITELESSHKLYSTSNIKY
jgi:hypothetical protein